MNNSLELNQINLSYDQEGLFRTIKKQTILKNLSLSLEKGEIGCVLGPSGCGKTSLLRAIAGFLNPEKGIIFLNEKQVLNSEKKINIPAEKRNVGMVFQDYALFPHLNVQENILFALTKGKIANATKLDLKRSNYLLDLTGLNKYSTRSIHSLSGGQKQRVALARALAPNPTIILFDEPFSNLDPELRQRLVKDVREMLKITKTTALFVTHDQQEAFSLSDKVGVIIDGNITQWVSPYDLYHKPKTIKIAKFIGEGAFISGTQIGKIVSTAIGSFKLKRTTSSKPNQIVKVLLRPDDIIHDDKSLMRAKVIRKDFRGADFLYTLELKSKEEVLSLVPSHHDHEINKPIGIKLEVDHVITFISEEKSSTF